MESLFQQLRRNRWSWTGLTLILLALPAVALGALAAGLFVAMLSPVLLLSRAGERRASASHSGRGSAAS